MKKLILFTLILVSLNEAVFAQKVLKLGDNTGSINPAAILELDASLHPAGLLLPRVPSTGSITSPTSGLIIFNTGDNKLYIYDGSTWYPLASSLAAISSLNGLTGTVQTFATGTTGTDFNLSSVGTVHTFNCKCK